MCFLFVCVCVKRWILHRWQMSVPQLCRSTFNLVQIYYVSRRGNSPFASCVRRNWRSAPTLNKEKGVFGGPWRRRGCVIFDEANTPCDSCHNLLEARLREGMRWTHNKRYIRQEWSERQSVYCSNCKRDERPSCRKFKLELKTEQRENDEQPI